MKFTKIITLGGLGLFGLLQGAIAQTARPFTIDGKVPSTTKTIKLMYYDFDTDEMVEDSTAVRNGAFALKGNITGASYAGLYFLGDSAGTNGADEFWFYLNPGRNTIDATQGKKAMLVAGDAPAQKYIDFKKDIEEKKSVLKTPEYEAEVKKIEELREQLVALEEGLKEQYGTNESIYEDAEYEFIQNNPDNTLSLQFLKGYLDKERPDYAKWKALYEALSADIRNTPKGLEIAKLIESEAVKEGGIAPDFTQEDVDGKPFQFSSIKGKYVLIDFWASWCVPCRKENPNVVKAYQKYKDKNFEIVGISLDTQRESWIKAIADDKLEWINVSDLKGWKNEVSMDYGIKAVPSNFLVDPEGKIIGVNLRGEDLEKKLAEILE